MHTHTQTKKWTWFWSVDDPIFSQRQWRKHTKHYLSIHLYKIIANWIKYLCVCVYRQYERMTNLHDIQTRHFIFSRYFMLDFISIVIHIHIFSWMTAMTKCKSSENICHKNEFSWLPKTNECARENARVKLQSIQKLVAKCSAKEQKKYCRSIKL